jgi:hypothetical protein
MKGTTMMHPIDEAIYDGTLTRELLAEHASLPLPDVGVSYWGDAMRETGDAVTAARRAARRMSTSLASLAAVRR